MKELREKVFTLANGVKMPQMGFGTAGINDPDYIAGAAQFGYRNFDTATDYANEDLVGEGLCRSGIPREELFVTTKVWNSKHGYDKTLKAFDFSLNALGVDYIDLYLIHWPCPDFNLYVDTWKAMEQLYKDGKIRAIGVANFYKEWLEDIIRECEIVPMVNQLEINPYHQHTDLHAYCRENGILLEAYTPIARGMVNDDATLQEIAKKYDTTPSVITLAFLMQEGIAVIPKTTKKERLESNAQALKIKLDEADVVSIRGLNEERIVTGEDPYLFHVLTDRERPIGM